MSKQDVELVRHMFERYSADDVDAWVACWDETGEWIAAAFQPLEGATRTYRGHEGLRRFHADVLDAFAGMTVHGEQFSETGGRVLVLGKISGRGAASGAAFEQPMAWLFEVRDGKLVRGRDYFDPERALEDAERPQK
jgi:ketosteroid isomerase-like protein